MKKTSTEAVGDAAAAGTMKVTVEREQLAQAVAWAARALPARPTSPVLAGMRLTADGGTLTLDTFDYEVSARAQVPADVGGPGTIIVSGRLLSEIVKLLPAKPAELVADGTRAVLTCGAATFTLILLPAEEYPKLPDLPAEAGTIGAHLLAEAAGQVAVAVGKDDTLPAITAVRAEIRGGTLTLIATDRYRLAVRRLAFTPAAGAEDTETDLLIPGKTLLDCARALAGGDVTRIYLEGTGDSGLAGFAGAGRQATTRLMSGEFPKYAGLIPAEFTASAVLPAAGLTEAVKRVALVLERNTPIRLEFTAAGDGTADLALEGGASDESEAREVLTGVPYEGEPITLSFNPGYLIDGVTGTGAEQVRFAFTTPVKPAVLTAAAAGEGTGQPAAPDYLYLIMPIRGAG